MTLVDRTTADAVETPGIEPAPASWWDRCDDWLSRAGERLNPILVKEARQALKSRQFMVTFTLVLACCWVWSMLGPSLIGPSVYYSAQGPYMFCGYFVVLSFPLMVIVPFGAFRSLAGEREDGTFELLSVTTLRPRMVVSGKLGSALLQMLVYLSAIAPCLAFTYLLKGLDFPTILFVMLYTSLGSLGLSLIGLLLATATQERHWQAVLSVFLLVGLLFAFGMSIGMVFSGMGELAGVIGDRYFWISNAAFLMGYASYFALFFCAAAAQLTFASDNRSTALRVVMVAQQVLFAGWMGWVYIDQPDPICLFIFLLLSGIHWFVMGAFMVGESGDLSQRVKRRLPQSFLGRAFLTWFNPGPAAGYMFAVTNLFAAILLGLLGTIACELLLPAAPRAAGSQNWITTEMLLTFTALGFSYVVIYLGLGRLTVSLLRKVANVPMVAGVLVQILLLVAGCGIPLCFHLMLPDIRDDYSLLEISNPFWTLAEIVENRNLTVEIVTLLCVLPSVAIVVFLGSLPSAARAVRQVRIDKPKRVAEEDAQLAAKLAPPKHVPTSPWDE